MIECRSAPIRVKLGYTDLSGTRWRTVVGFFLCSEGQILVMQISTGDVGPLIKDLKKGRLVVVRQQIKTIDSIKETDCKPAQVKGLKQKKKSNISKISS